MAASWRTVLPVEARGVYVFSSRGAKVLLRRTAALPRLDGEADRSGVE
jgi:hypothetical protein